jgi:flavin-dependent dehydrogenase
MDYELVVVGGGLAGSSLGMAMAQHGARVLILEKEAAFKDRVRGEGMLPWGAAGCSRGPSARAIPAAARQLRQRRTMVDKLRKANGTCTIRLRASVA